MALTINHNLMAENVARNLSTHYGAMSTSTQRLSSGLRINSSADDAAGLAVRELMRSDIATMNQGIRNANDAISMIQTADGALQVVDEKLIRMKELAEQAATGTYTSDQRIIINSEYQAMALEIQRISDSTDFNGIHLLNGNLSGTYNGSGLNSIGKAKIHFGTGNSSAEDYYYVSIGSSTIKSLFDPNNTAIGNATAAGINLYGPSDTEIKVNSYDSGDQNESSSAGLTNGNVIVTWTSENQDGSGSGVFGKIITADGQTVVQDFQINTTTTNDQSSSSVTSLSSGGFVVAWQSQNQDGSGLGIYMQQFSSTGARIGGETLVNDTTANNQTAPNVIGLDNGGYFISWNSVNAGSTESVNGKIYNADGTVSVSEFPINNDPAMFPRYPHAAELTNGSIIETWFGQDGSDWGVFGQLLDKQGNLIGNSFQINTQSSNLQNFQDVAALDDGKFVAVWSDVDGPFSTVAPSNVKAQIFNSDGTKLGKEFTVNDTTIPINPQQSIPKVTSLKEGGYAVCWRAPGDSDLCATYTQIYDNNGNKIDSNKIVNISEVGDQNGESISSMASGGFIVTYSSNSTGDDNVLARVYSPMVNISTQTRAQTSLAQIDSAMIEKDKIRANLGATQNRLENTISNLQIQAENLQAAESQISDTDVAQEMTTFVREQILSQAAVAMLAQANSMPKMALQLINGQ